MRAYKISCDVIADQIVSSIQNAALHSEIELKKTDLKKIAAIVKTATNMAANNSSRQIQAVFKKHQEQKKKV
jgi:hypothetical protein